MKLKYIVPVALLGLASAGCTKNWLDINQNPNQLPTSTPDFVLASGINRTVATVTPNETGSYWSAQWTQSNTYIINGPIFQYIINNTNFNYWDGYYDILGDFQYAIDNADGMGQPFVKGPAKIMQAYIFQQLTDLYGNIPFTDALKGTGALTPSFDDQKDVYKGLITLLDNALADIAANPEFLNSSKSSDLVFGGNLTSWVQFANSLKLRILIRQSRVADLQGYIETELAKVAADPVGVLGAAMDVTSSPGYLGSTGQTNPLYDYIGYDANGTIRPYARFPRPTTFLFDNLVATNDTFRLKRLAYAKGGEDGGNPGKSKVEEVLANYAAVPYGISSGYLSQNTSYIGPSVIIRNQFNKRMMLMTAAESFFLLAEAKQRFPSVSFPALVTDGTAKGFYEQGVKESFRLTGTLSAYGLDKADVLLHSGKDLADWEASPDKLKAIWMQKWIALTNFSGLESWSEFRRTGFPVIPKSAAAAVDAVPPVRIFYPSTELGSNTANVKAQGDINIFTDRLFWDVD
ncbi:SusD/RagB family nutrient-binding outer membrane lipoprotein [Flavihumibacter petaseus]|uniref:SusD/RagB family nutrient-binding outer membrane lipoprotein n=1 Tax=Flavihumibacter petaseus NBRC 106054 TaxID=1220578 RepID=A0A0E9MWZ1_9BACT|nr:SusD/RagB family nutrient-binding outer membrane lipoprotein [Flavihumibacter petaseus]GAO42104.1 hypothetical protein FPE01S_01_11170 [Flavihumibacter petaseus NBRC 106054]